MTNWFPFHYRDVLAWRAEGLELSTPSDQAAKLLDAVITEACFYDADPVHGRIDQTLKAMLQADPDFVMGRCVSHVMEVLGGFPELSPVSLTNFAPD